MTGVAYVGHMSVFWHFGTECGVYLWRTIQTWLLPYSPQDRLNQVSAWILLVCIYTGHVNTNPRMAMVYV